MQKQVPDRESPYHALGRARRERVLYAIGRAVAAGSSLVAAVYIALLFLAGPAWQLAAVAGASVGGAVLGLLASRMARLGRADTASYILLIYILLGSALVGLTLEGMAPAIAPAFLVAIVMAGLLLGPRGGYAIAAAACALWTISVLMIARRGLVVPTSIPAMLPDIVLVGTIWMAFFLTAVLSQIAILDLRNALDLATYDLVQANRELEEANRLKSQFVARMSHDLRTPLNAISLTSQLMARRYYGSLSDEQEDGLDRIMVSASRLQTLIDDILDLSKIEAGQLDLEDEALQVSSLVEALRIELEPTAVKKGLQFSISVSSDMPAQIRGDETRLAQILFNLTDNAIKFTDTGEVAVSLELLDEDRWRISVRDTGRGIHEKGFERIFEEFHREEAATVSGTKGSGLGLAIAGNLVQLMQGEIVLDSQLGRGSVFQVILPLRLPA
jgi:signal transduction histidine kinase